LAPINLTKTQTGYVPLVDRFIAFPSDAEKSPADDKQFYFDNFANGTLEKATLDLLYPTPDWLRCKIQAKKMTNKNQYLTTGESGLAITFNNKISTVWVAK
jgi:hypothetical protein